MISDLKKYASCFKPTRARHCVRIRSRFAWGMAMLPCTRGALFPALSLARGWLLQSVERPQQAGAACCARPQGVRITRQVPRGALPRVPLSVPAELAEHLHRCPPGLGLVPHEEPGLAPRRRVDCDSGPLHCTSRGARGACVCVCVCVFGTPQSTFGYSTLIISMLSLMT